MTKSGQRTQGKFWPMISRRPICPKKLDNHQNSLKSCSRFPKNCCNLKLQWHKFMWSGSNIALKFPLDDSHSGSVEITRQVIKEKTIRHIAQHQNIKALLWAVLIIIILIIIRQLRMSNTWRKTTFCNFLRHSVMYSVR